MANTKVRLPSEGSLMNGESVFKVISECFTEDYYKQHVAYWHLVTDTTIWNSFSISSTKLVNKVLSCFRNQYTAGKYEREAI